MHLDLKPDNILLANEGTKDEWTAKIADFGWVPELNQDEWTGTPLYMAPEFAIRNLELAKLMGVALPTDNVGPAADVFSFGVLLWEMFARQTPFEALTALRGGTPPPCSCESPLQDTAEGGTAFCLRIMSRWMVGEEQMRPEFPRNFPTALKVLVEACWDQTPTSRPRFTEVKKALASTEVGWFAPAATPAPPQTVQKWLDTLGLGSKAESFIEMSGLQEGEKYSEGLKTIDDTEFQELLEDLEDLEEAVDEMVGEDDGELTGEEAVTLKKALHVLLEADSEPQSEALVTEISATVTALLKHSGPRASFRKVAHADSAVK
jgi:serine/threonine protein kinase